MHQYLLLLFPILFLILTICSSILRSYYTPACSKIETEHRTHRVHTAGCRSDGLGNKGMGFSMRDCVSWWFLMVFTGLW